METGATYTQHKSLMQNYTIGDGRKEYQAPFAEAFEKIYEEADEEDIKLSNAKEFLSSLDRSELRTVQKYNGLADAIDIGALSAEGAYNLLVHDNEQFDFDNDGIMEVGAGRSLMPIPRNMPADVKAAYIEALNSLDGREKLMAMTISFDIERLKSLLNNTPYTPSTIDYDYIQNRVDDILDPNRPGFASEEFKGIVQKFWDNFKSAFEDLKNDSDEPLENESTTVLEDYITSSEYIAILNELLKTDEKEVGSLETLLATLSKIEQDKQARTPEEIIAEYRAMPGQGGIFYEGMFEEQRAASLARHEPYFKAEYEHYEKYKDIFTPIYSNYTTQKANTIAKELNAQFPEFQAMREKAYRGGTEEDKAAFEDMFWDYQAYNKYLKEKHNMDMSTGGFMAATKESSKAYNYAVYDALESGLSIKEATSKARSLLSSFGGGEAQAFSLMFFMGYPEDIEEATQIPEEEIDYDKQIDLRDYGFEHNFLMNSYRDNFENDLDGIKARIMYDIELYSFLLQNNELVDRKLDELKERAYTTEYGKEWYDDRNEDGGFNERFKSSFQEKHENALYAQKIFDKYADKIFDNSLLDRGV